MDEISKVYDPQEVEARIYREWEEAGYFRADPHPSKEPYTIVIPPPNVTGALHIGHALDNTLQDVLIRFKRMQGYAALWIPGTDHAGIATQNVVERELAKEHLTRHDLGREKFVECVWDWKQKYGSVIIGQLKRLGASCDWSRERFTMDEGLSRAVRRVFVDWFDEGLIYKGNRIINWCPRCETAISDIEVTHLDEEGELVRFSYPLEDGSGKLTVATTRLETMLGDTAIAVNPNDDRYKSIIGKAVVHPFDDRRIPIVADDAVDPAFGTGAVKVTPAHDPVDFEIGERHDLPKINIFNRKAEVNENGGRFAGLERYAAREAVRAALKEKGLLEGADVHQHAVGHCSRCGTAVEPWLSEQWFVKMKPLAEPAVEAVKEGRVSFTPARWTNYYLNWMDQIRDWCISRQLWWGHRIPVWYCECGHYWAATDEPEKCLKCGSDKLSQDPDVLDTWFSSQLWPFSTLGWPEQTEDLKFFYPTSVLVTGYEIIHLWVARMVMAGLHSAGDVPFSKVVVHGIVRDADGRKMSKSLGNVVDPLELIDRFGTDALRFTLGEHATGQDIYLDEQWVEGSRNFANKLWNASRFVLSSIEGITPGHPDVEALTLEDRWIISRLASTVTDVTGSLDSYEFAAAARSLYEFIWSEFCDWYIEAAKIRLYGEDPKAKEQVVNVLLSVLGSALKLLHPLMPFITEEIWQKLPGVDRKSIMISDWPVERPGWLSDQSETNFAVVKEIVSAVRRFRSQYNIGPSVRVQAAVHSGDDAVKQLVVDEIGLIKSLARLGEVTFQPGSNEEGQVARLSAGQVDIFVPLAGLVDIDAERTRLGKSISQTRDDMGKISAKLSNEQFRSKAPAEIVNKQEEKLALLTEQHSKLVAELEQLA